MDFVHYDLSQLSGGEVVQVTLANAANVRLLDEVDFGLYRQGGQYRYRGGYVTRSPYAIRVPAAGHWHLVLDLGGYAGQIRSSVRVLPPSNT
ncbi:MAG: DUF1883 domain-containing protein [Solirubrobacteraceae bacterium]